MVTGLINKYMPLMRYKTGDTGLISSKCPCGYKGGTIKLLEGRKMNPVVLKDGDLLNTYVLKEVGRFKCYLFSIGTINSRRDRY